MNRRTKIVLFGSALLLAAGAASAATASDEPRQREAAAAAKEAAALTGTAELYRSAGDDITFTFDAHLAAKDTADPTKDTGSFEFGHHLDGKGAWAKAKVDCLVTGGTDEPRPSPACPAAPTAPCRGPGRLRRGRRSPGSMWWPRHRAGS